jgi:hypothetical protein
MLDTMSKILAFTVEEKQNLGLLAKKPSLEGDCQQKGIKDSLISFFMQEDDD